MMPLPEKFRETCELIPSLAEQDYHTRGWVGHTALNAYITRGFEWWCRRYIFGQIPAPEATESLLVGSALDLAVSEGMDAARARYIERPAGMDLRTAAGKAWCADALAAGAAIVPTGTMEYVTTARDRILFTLVDEGYPHFTLDIQRSYRGLWSETLNVQTRPDLASPRPALIDIKTTNDIVGFDRKFIEYGYHFQAGLYAICHLAATGETLEHIAFLAVETGSPYPRTRWAPLTPAQIDACVSQTIEALDALSADLKDTNPITLPRKSRCRQGVSIPPWAWTSPTWQRISFQDTDGATAGE